MLDPVLEWVEEELRPALGVVTGLSIRAIDSLPLPALVVLFLFLMILLQWPEPRHSHLLPSYSPSMTEKSRLSPLPQTPPSFSTPPSTPRFLPTSSPVHYPTFDEHGRPQFVVASVHDLSSAGSGTRSPPRLGGGIGRRGHKRRGLSGSWRRSNSSLAIVDEALEDKAEV